jgi:sec-independent protein translocase protein TatA
VEAIIGTLQEGRVFMLGDIGLPELLVIFVIVLVLFGPGKLPDVGKAIGEAVRGFKKAMRADEESIEDKTAEKEKDRQQKDHA